MSEYAMVRPGYRIKADGTKHQAQYYDTYVKRWFDIGDPKDTRSEAAHLIDESHRSKAEQS